MAIAILSDVMGFRLRSLARAWLRGWILKVEARFCNKGIGDYPGSCSIDLELSQSSRM